MSMDSAAEQTHSENWLVFFGGEVGCMTPRTTQVCMRFSFVLAVVMMMNSAAEQQHSEDWLRFLGRGGVCDRQNDLCLYAISILSGGHYVDGQRS